MTHSNQPHQHGLSEAGWTAIEGERGPTLRERADAFARQDAHDLTTQHIAAAMAAAIQEHDMPAAAALIKLLAVREPDLAQLVLDVIDLRVTDLKP